MYQRILAPLDGSELAECVLPHVTAIATGCMVKDIRLVQVLQDIQVALFADLSISEELARQAEAEQKAAAESYLRGKVDLLTHENLNVEFAILRGSVAESIIEYANSNGVDLIIISTHGRSGVSRWIRGSVADRLLRASCIPILMIRAPGCEHSIL